MSEILNENEARDDRIQLTVDVSQQTLVARLCVDGEVLFEDVLSDYRLKRFLTHALSYDDEFQGDREPEAPGYYFDFYFGEDHDAVGFHRPYGVIGTTAGFTVEKWLSKDTFEAYVLDWLFKLYENGLEIDYDDDFELAMRLGLDEDDNEEESTEAGSRVAAPLGPV